MTLVDVVTGAVGPIRDFGPDNRGLRFLFGDGNQWAEVGEATAVVPTQVGTLTIDLVTGEPTLHSAMALESENPPCCDIAAYPARDRIVIAD